MPRFKMRESVALPAHSAVFPLKEVAIRPQGPFKLELYLNVVFWLPAVIGII